MIQQGDVVRLVPRFECRGTRTVARLLRGRFGYISLLRGQDLDYAELVTPSCGLYPFQDRPDIVPLEWLEKVS